MKKKEDVISFKVDEDLMSVLKEIPNRSEFIRKALIQALGVTCPLCNGNGMLNAGQCRHWEVFSHGHSVEHCDRCNENHLVCARDH
ncbi:MAG: ribbon-helix-helix domain-containing protein [Syntrophales bacterium]|nr:ribbon-helix-helix domain-containing protein [Syntrophales bacterium]